MRGNLPLNGSNTGTLDADNTSDFWCVTISADGALQVNVTNDSTLVVDLILYDADGRQLAGDGSRDGDQQVFRQDLAPGTYSVQVSRAGGNGAYQIAVTANGPNAFPFPAATDFGSVPIGQVSASKQFTLKNAGLADLVVGDLLISVQAVSDFTIQEDFASGQPIPPQGSRTFKVVFSPSASGVGTAVVEIPTNDPDTPVSVIELKGSGKFVLPSLSISGVSIFPVGGSFGDPIVQGVANSTQAVIVNTGETVIPSGTPISVGLFARDSEGRVIQPTAFKTTLPTLAPSEQVTITSPPDNPFKFLSTKTTNLTFLVTNDDFGDTAHTTPMLISPELDDIKSCFYDVAGLATGAVCFGLGPASVTFCSIAASGQTVVKMLNEGRFFKIGGAIESGDPRRAGQETSTLLLDTLAVADNLVLKGALGPEFEVLGQLVSGVNGDSCIFNKAGEFAQWTIGLMTSLLTKDAESIKKIWSFIVDSPADIFVSDSAGNLTSVMGTGAVAEGIPSSQGLLLKTDPVIKIVNILEAGDQYKITLRGTGEGGTGLTIFQPKSDGGLVQIKYTNIPTTASSKATITLDGNTRNYILMLDIDGNGTVDQQLSPDNIGIVINVPPTANAGPDQTVRLGSFVNLNGSASSDPDNGPSPLSFAWSKIAGPAATLTGATTPKPTFTPNTAGGYTFNLTVNDGASDSAPDSVTITVPKLGDIDRDGDVDNNDLNLILAARNTPASGPNDLCDLNGDLKIDALDARKFTLLCTRPRCAT
jgi:hypothetical protein